MDKKLYGVLQTGPMPMPYKMSRWYFLLHGKQLKVENLQKYCIDNSLSYTSMRNVGKGIKTDYEGYTVDRERIQVP